MPTRLESLQTGINIVGNRKEEIAQPLFTSAYLSPWLQSLPGNCVLDLASGQGIEAKAISRQGFEVVAQDVSPSMLAGSYFEGLRVLGCAEVLPYADGTFDGILLKDALVFMDPISRDEMFLEAQRVLAPKGSMLISSESTNMRVWRQDAPGKLPYREFFETNDDWERIVEECSTGHDYSIYFQTDPNSIVELARQHGFKQSRLTQYPFNHPLGGENRWIKRGGFVLELKKKTKR